MRIGRRCLPRAALSRREGLDGLTVNELETLLDEKLAEIEEGGRVT